MRPQCIQRKTTKGWRMPPNTVYVGRGRGSYGRWGNYCEGTYAVEEHASWLANQPLFVQRIQDELKGYNLACWCRLDKPCHTDTLLWIANCKNPGIPCPGCETKVYPFRLAKNDDKPKYRFSAYCHKCKEVFFGYYSWNEKAKEFCIIDIEPIELLTPSTLKATADRLKEENQHE